MSDRFNDDITIRGEATDDAGISSITISVYDSSNTPVDVIDASGVSTESNTATAEGTNAFSYVFRSRQYTAAAGSFRFVVTATDRAGAQNAYIYYDDVVRAANGGAAVTVEQLYRLERPEAVSGLTIAPSLLESIQDDFLPIEVDQDLDSPYFVFSSPSAEQDTLGEGAWAIGTVRDDDGIVPGSIEIRFDPTDAAAWTPITSTTGSGISVAWEHNLATLEEGQHTIELRATDINGLSATSPVITFVIDSGVPIVDIQTPAAGSYLNGGTAGEITIAGTARDTVGVAGVSILIDGSVSYVPVSDFDITAYTEVDGTIEWSWSHVVAIPADGSWDGSRQFRVKVTDTSGKTSTENLQVYIDTAAPELAFLGIATGETVNGEVFIQGTTQNASPIVRLTLSVDSAADAVTADTYVLDATTNELDTDSSGSRESTVYRWYKSIDTTAYPDGELSVSMTALDAAGNTGTALVSLTVDQTTDIPRLWFDNLDDRPDVIATDNAFFGSATLIGRVTDDDAVDTDSVEVRIDSGAWGAVSSVTGTGLSVNWEHMLPSIDEGEHTVEIRATDIYGNEIASTAVPFLIDNGAPQISITAVSLDDGSRTIASSFQGAFVNGDFTISGTASDGFGVAGVEVKINGAAEYTAVSISDPVSADGVETVSWEFPVAIEGMAEGTISITVRSLDHTGKTANSDLQLVLDTTAPVVEYILPAASATVNGTIVLSGVASDTNKVDQVYYIITNGSVPSADPTASGSGWTRFGQTYSWNASVDTRSLTATGPTSYTAHVVAYDAAGNRSDGGVVADAAKRVFTVNQATDKPVVSFSNVSSVALDNLFTTAPGSMISGQISDDDGVDPTGMEIRTRIGSSPFNAWQNITTVEALSVSGTGRNITFAYALSALSENPEAQTIEIRAADTNPDGTGAVVSDAVAASFYIDNSAPTIVETAIATTAQVIRSAGFDIAGTIADSNSVASVSIVATKDGTSQSTPPPTTYTPPTTSTSYSYTRTVSSAGTDDGLWVFTITVADAAGRTASTTRTVLVDATAPTTPLIDAFAGSYAASELVASGTTSDDGSGLLTVEYSLDYTDNDIDDDTWLTLTGTGNWYKTIDVSALPEGAGTLSVRSTDRAGNISAIASRSFVVDRANPVISITGYTGTVYRNGEFTIGGTVSDTLPLPLNEAAFVTVTATADGTPITLAAPTVSGTVPTTRSWSQLIPIGSGDGNYVVTITATDAVGRSSTATRTVVVDTTPPVIDTISNLSDGALVQVLEFAVNGSASDTAGSGVSSVEYSLGYTDNGIDDDTWLAATGTTSWSVPLSLTEALSQTIAFRATDAAGNVSTVDASRIVFFDVDASNPVLTETVSGIASAATVYRNADVPFGGAATDGNAVTSVIARYSKDGGESVTLLNDTTDDGAWSTTLPTSLGDGAYELTVVATDEVAKTTSFVRNIVIDTAAPDLTITAPVANELVGSSSYTIRGQVTDNAGKGVTALQYSTTGLFAGEEVTVPLSGLNRSVAGVNFSTGGEGTKTLWARATDGLNGYNTQTVEFNYDLTPPTLSETTVATSSLVLSNSVVSFAGSATDTNALESVTITATREGISVPELFTTTTAGSYSYSKTMAAEGTEDGTWVFTITATDVAGRTTVIERNVEVDRSTPLVPVINAFPGSYVENELSISGTAVDDTFDAGTPGTGIASVGYQIDATAIDGWTAVNGSGDWFRTIDLSALAEGLHTVYVRSTDRAGNISQIASRGFVVDRNNPVISTGEAATQSVKADFSLTGTASDTAGLGLGSISATAALNGGTANAVTVSGTAASWSINVDVDTDGAAGGDTTGIEEGTWEYVITVSDSVGRISTRTLTAIVDVSPPVVVISTPAPADVAGASTLTIAGTADDSGGTGVALVEYTLTYSDDLNDTNDGWAPLTGPTNWNKSISLGTEGAKTLTVRARDQLSTYSDPVSVSFGLDLTPPIVTETGVGTSAPKRSGTFTISGTALDTNGFLTWDDPNDGTADLVPYVEISRNGALPAEKVSVSTADDTWSLEQDPAALSLSDGDITYTVTATDVVSKTTTITRIVTLDTGDPTITIDGVIAGLNVSTNQVNGEITFRFSADDPGVGLEKSGSNYIAYYTVSANNAVIGQTAADIVGWTPITSAGSVFSFNYDTTVHSSAGDYDLHIGIRDAVPTNPNSTTVKYDLAVDQNSDRPVISIDNLDETAATNNVNGLGQNPSILVTIQDDDSVSVAGLEYRIDVDNDGSFTSAVDLNGDGDTVDRWENEAIWYAFDEFPGTDQSLVQGKILLSSSPQGLFGIQVRARDSEDTSAWIDIYDDLNNFTWQKTDVVPFSVDYGPPTLNVTAPTSGTYNTNFALTATAVDALGVIDVKYSMVGETTSLTDVDLFDGDQGTVSINTTVDISTLVTGEYILQVVATDQGNYSVTQQIPVTIDKTAPTTNPKKSVIS